MPTPTEITGKRHIYGNVPVENAVDNLLKDFGWYPDCPLMSHMTAPSGREVLVENLVALIKEREKKARKT
jgi:hypothetical protein